MDAKHENLVYHNETNFMFSQNKPYSINVKT